jgi:hypothetical protein
VRSRSGPTVAPVGAEAEHMSSAIPLCGHRTCYGIEEKRVLASVSTIVVVAGQTQIHVVTLATVRPAIVPPIVPGLGSQECSITELARPAGANNSNHDGATDPEAGFLVCAAGSRWDPS